MGLTLEPVLSILLKGSIYTLALYVYLGFLSYLFVVKSESPAKPGLSKLWKGIIPAKPLKRHCKIRHLSHLLHSL